ncbi:MAG: hypothetical protein ABI307_15670 [Mycobacterium sp.]
MAAFGASTNADLAETNTGIAADDTDRKGHAADAVAKFSANETDAVSQFEGVGAQDAGQLAQQLPQAMSGVMQGVTGALGSLGKLPQSLMQAGQGALQPLMSAVQSAGKGGLGGLGGAQLASDVSPDPSGMGGAGSGIGGSGGGLGMGTTPASNLGPPPVPASSTPTTPAGALSKVMPGGSGPGGGGPGGSPAGGMMPMMPGGAGAGGKGGKDDKVDEKRIAAPGVPNGQPVKGRATTPPSVPVTKSVGNRPGQPITTAKKRILSEDDPSA